MADKVVKTDEEWRKILTPQQFHVLREKGTERAFSGEYYASHDRAMYVCASRERSLFVNASPGIQPVTGRVNVPVSEIAAASLSMPIAAAAPAAH